MSNMGNNILVFDGTCGLCDRIVKFLKKRDHAKRITYVASQSPEGQAIIEAEDLTSFDNDTVIFIDAGYCYFQSTAAIKALSALGGKWKHAMLLLKLPVCCRDNIYRLIARKRYFLFGRVNTCEISAVARKNSSASSSTN